MKSQNLIISTLILVVAIAVSYAFATPHFSTNSEVNEEYLSDFDEDQQDWNSCVEKAASEWGGGCMNYGFSEDKYTVHLLNKCSDKVDLMCCVQHTNDRWHCFYRMDMNQNDTLHAYTCQGNGKYLKWVRKAGDVQTKFPTREQVNSDY